MVTIVQSVTIDPLIQTSYGGGGKTDAGVCTECAHTESKREYNAVTYSIDPKSDSYYDPSEFCKISEDQCKEVLNVFDSSLVRCEISDNNLNCIGKKPNNLLAICAKVLEFFKGGIFPADRENSWTRKLIIAQIFLENSNLLEESALFLGRDFLKQDLFPRQNDILTSLLRTKSKHLSKIRAMILNVCERSAAEMTPGSGSESGFNVLSGSANWVKLLMKATRTSSRCFYHNLEHICHGDGRGGGRAF